MAFLPALSAKELHRYHRVVTRSVEVRHNFDVLAWLQGDLQRYLPHDITIAAWGNFQLGQVQNNILSRLKSVRSQDANPESVTPFLLKLFNRWTEFHKQHLAFDLTNRAQVVTKLTLQDMNVQT